MVGGSDLGRPHRRRGHPQSLPGGQLAGAGTLVRGDAHLGRQTGQSRRAGTDWCIVEWYSQLV